MSGVVGMLVIATVADCDQRILRSGDASVEANWVLGVEMSGIFPRLEFPLIESLGSRSYALL